MDREKINLIVRNLESLVECLKKELDFEVDSYKMSYGDIVPHLADYDEIFVDSDLDDYE